MLNCYPALPWGAGPGRHSTRPRLSRLAHARGGPAHEGLADGVGEGLPARGVGVIMLTQASARPRPYYLKHWTQHGCAHSDACPGCPRARVRDNSFVSGPVVFDT